MSEFLQDEREVPDAERRQNLHQRVPADVSDILGSTLQHLTHLDQDVGEVLVEGLLGQGL